MENNLIVTITDLTKIFNLTKSTLGVILSRSQYSKFEVRTQTATLTGKLFSSRGYKLTLEFLELLEKDLKKLRVIQKL